MLFVEHMAESKDRWKAHCFPNDKGYAEEYHSLQSFAEMYTDSWMAYSHIVKRSDFGRSNFQNALRFAHLLLQDDNGVRYRVEPDEARDASIHERVGLWGAGSRYCELYIDDIPALVDYSIDEYDGQETVDYGHHHSFLI